MIYIRTLGLAVLAAMALMASIGAGSASATTLEVGGVAKNSSVSIEASVAAGGSTIFKDTNNLTIETCTGWTMKAATVTPFTGSTVTAPISNMSYTGCSHKLTVIKPGRLHIAWNSGTKGTTTLSESEVTVENTIFGISCIAKTGTGTDIGTLTGVASGTANWDFNGVIPMGACGDLNMTGTGTVTSPSGLGVVN